MAFEKTTPSLPPFINGKDMEPGQAITGRYLGTIAGKHGNNYRVLTAERGELNFSGCTTLHKGFEGIEPGYLVRVTFIREADSKRSPTGKTYIFEVEVDRDDFKAVPGGPAKATKAGKVASVTG